ncbi:MAG: peptide chain release factor N(5)-glutamine methyltransferase [Armatimonadetes bacterium]|nr:peptide chain release factor N(5)-glutamine methyltransferase [Armatimonadota bacterium]
MERPGSLRDAYLEGREHLTARGIEAAALEAEVLLRHAAGLERSRLFGRWTQPIDDGVWRAYVALLEVRADGCPLAYVTGQREFYGLTFAVDERVLIPRPETELLVDVLREVAEGGPEASVAPVLVDVGTGSGAVAIAASVTCPTSRVFATDVSPEALAVARDNAARHGVAPRLSWLVGDGLAPVLALGISADAIVCNPPYVPIDARDDVDPGVREHEPAIAVFAGPTGLELHRRIAEDARRVLRTGGVLGLEVAAKWDQADRVSALLIELGYAAVERRRDLAGWERVVVARWKS